MNIRWFSHCNRDGGYDVSSTEIANNFRCAFDSAKEEISMKFNLQLRCNLQIPPFCYKNNQNTPYSVTSQPANKSKIRKSLFYFLALNYNKNLLPQKQNEKIIRQLLMSYFFSIIVSKDKDK